MHMLKHLTLVVLWIVGMTFALTPEEFRELYQTPEKNADTCYRLYQAYAQGDGVEKNDSYARKWLLAAYRCGMVSTRKEIASLPWRSLPSYKSEMALDKADVDDETALLKGKELLDLLMGWRSKSNGIGMHGKREMKPEDMQRVRELVAAGADLNMLTSFSGTYYSALSIACQEANSELVKLFIDNGADPCANSLLALTHALFRYSEDSRAYALSEKGAPRLDWTPKTEGKPATPRRLIPLSRIEKDTARIVQLLIDNGLDLNMWTEYGWSVASVVVNSGDIQSLALLVKAGLDLEKRQNIHECCVSETLPEKRMKYLVTTGVVKQEERPVYLSVSNNLDAMLRELIRYGVDATGQCYRGITLLEYAQEMERTSRSNADYHSHAARIVDLLQKAQAAHVE